MGAYGIGLCKTLGFVKLVLGLCYSKYVAFMVKSESSLLILAPSDSLTFVAPKGRCSEGPSS